MVVVYFKVLLLLVVTFKLMVLHKGRVVMCILVVRIRFGISDTICTVNLRLLQKQVNLFMNLRLVVHQLFRMYKKLVNLMVGSWISHVIKRSTIKFFKKPVVFSLSLMLRNNCLPLFM